MFNIIAHSYLLNDNLESLCHISEEEMIINVSNKFNVNKNTYPIDESTHIINKMYDITKILIDADTENNNEIRCIFNEYHVCLLILSTV